MSTPPRARRPPLVLVAILLIAFAVGAAASSLAGASVASPPPAGSTTLLYVSTGLVAEVVGLLGLLVLGFFIYGRVRGDSAPIPNQLAVLAFVIVLLLVLFVVAAHFLSSGGSLPTNATAPPPGSNLSVSHHGNNSTNGTLGGSGATDRILGAVVPSWLIFVGVTVVAVVVVIALLPLLAALRASRGARSPRDGAGRAAARTALARAADALDRGRDPRSVIIALYAELLARLSPLAGNLDADTPEEIRTLHLRRIGVEEGTSEALTRLFEEARYSSHPLGPDDAARAVTVIREAEADLGRAIAAAAEVA